MSVFQIGIVGMGVNPHVRCFEDFARALAEALRHAGHSARYADGGAGRLIAFGANNISDPNGQLPKDAIIYNTEQLAAVKDPKSQMVGHELFRERVVWDYSEANARVLRSLGIERAVLCPVGYVPEMTMIKPADEDIDVLFYGSVNDARREILNALDAVGLRVGHLFGVYGEERDRAIARAKVVLNLHYYKNGVFEIFRVSHLLANRKCVVTEAGGCDAALEALASRTCDYVPRERIVEECRRLCSSPESRRLIAEQGHEEFKKVSLVDSVRRALEES